MIKIKNIIISLLFLSALIIPYQKVIASASLYFAPSLKSYTVGDVFQVGVFVSSAEQAMNAASGIIKFPQDKIEVVSISKSGSIFNLWVQDPSFSNNNGVVNFEGIVLNPGFSGSGGRIITISFKAKSAGNAELKLSLASVLANDGKGSNILSKTGSANFDIELKATGPQPPKATTPAPISSAGAPLAPIVFSETHPDSNQWYANNNPKFSWSIENKITGVNVLTDRNPNSNPGIKSDGNIDHYDYQDVEDGKWYFHIRLRNTNGWGAITHYSFLIDTKKPESFIITEEAREDKTNPIINFVFDAKDESSGIDYYEIQIDSGSPQRWEDNENHIYKTPVLGNGKHIIIAKAIDKAGNFLASSVEFIIEPLESPIITECPHELKGNDILIAKGETYPNAQVVVWLQKEKDDPQSQIILSDKNGKFVFVADEKVKNGIYQLWVEVIDERGARSELTKKLPIAVKQPAVLKIGTQAVGFLSVITPLIALIFLLLSLFFFWWNKFSLMKTRVKKEVDEAEEVLEKAFSSLKNKIHNRIKLLEKTKLKRKLTEEEIKIIRQLKKDLNDAEKSIKKEIVDIKEEIK